MAGAAGAAEANKVALVVGRVADASAEAMVVDTSIAEGTRYIRK